MPRVKFDYIVSFSSEDPDNQANNLLAAEVSKKKWLCSKEEMGASCSVVLQMSKAVKISAIHIGAYSASFVEVLVGRSEKPNKPFQVLVASSVFLSVSEARREQAPERVRSFSGEQLSGAARGQRWDRLRVVCRQPHSKHCQYGLSFVHVFEPEETEVPHRALPSRLLNLETFSSDEDEFRPGELFAKHSQGGGACSSTEVQIRQASSQALKNLPGEAARLKKTSISKQEKHPSADPDRRAGGRDRRALVYEAGDDGPNEKVDRVVQRHRDEKSREHSARRDAQTASTDDKQEKKVKGTQNAYKQDKQKHEEHKHRTRDMPNANRMAQSKECGPETTSSSKQTDTNNTRKRRHSAAKKDTRGVTLPAGPASAAPHELLQGAVLVLSGYANPRRAALRTAALALGAQCRPDWDRTCTHLICAFPNTPKLKQVRSGAGGDSVPVVLGEWLERVAERRRLLPWQWYATEPERRLPEPPAAGDGGAGPKPDSECDTDDEIEKALHKQRRAARSPPPAPAPQRAASCEQTPRDSEPETEPDTDVEPDDQIDESQCLPDFFEGLTFVVRGAGAGGGQQGAALRRYVCAYGGLLLDEQQVQEDTAVDHVLDAGARAGAGAEGAHWLWRCHAARALLPRGAGLPDA